jgi:hypothetical protein
METKDLCTCEYLIDFEDGSKPKHKPDCPAQYQPTIIKQEDTVWGICVVPTIDGSPRLAIFHRKHDTWWGSATAGTHDSGALLGSANKDVHNALEAAYERMS